MKLLTFGMFKPIQNRPKQQGYIALLAVIIISALLLGVIAGLATQAALSRFNSLDRELKAQSRLLAEACTAQVILRYAFDSNYRGDESIEIDEQSCEVQPIITDDFNIKVVAMITSADLPTTLQTIVDTSDLSIVSQTELIN